MMSAQLEQIRFQMEEARRDVETRQQIDARQVREEKRRFDIQMIVTSIAGVTVAVAVIMLLMGKA